MLAEIVKNRKELAEAAKRRVSCTSLKAGIEALPPPRDFAGALKASPNVAIIAEIKKASPSKGLIRADFDPGKIAKIYEDNGASAISVLTEEKYFQGSIANLQLARDVTRLPLLCKDFTVDEYQIYEARACGADAVLLIVAALSVTQIKDYMDIAAGLGLGALVEVHSHQELQQALLAEAEIIGINNRDLKSLKVNLATTFDLLKRIPKGKTVVSESGISTREDVLKLREAGVDAALVGEALMREQDIGGKLRELAAQGNAQGR